MTKRQSVYIFQIKLFYLYLKQEAKLATDQYNFFETINFYSMKNKTKEKKLNKKIATWTISLVVSVNSFLI